MPVPAYQLAEVGVIRLYDSLHITRDMPEWELYRILLQEGYEPYPMPSPDDPTVAEVLVEIKTLITIKRDQVINSGATVGAITVHTDAAAMAELGQALQFSALQPARVFKIKTSNLVHVDMTASEISDLFDALAERVALCWDNEAAHYAAAADITTWGLADSEKIIELRAYDFSTGWPD